MNLVKLQKEITGKLVKNFFENLNYQNDSEEFEKIAFECEKKDYIGKVNIKNEKRKHIGSALCEAVLNVRETEFVVLFLENGIVKETKGENINIPYKDIENVEETHTSIIVNYTDIESCTTQSSFRIDLNEQNEKVCHLLKAIAEINSSFSFPIREDKIKRMIEKYN